MGILNLKLVILLEYQNIKIFWKRLHSKWVGRSFVIKKVKNTVSWTYVIINDLNEKETAGTFYEKELPKKKKKRSKRVLKK